MTGILVTGATGFVGRALVTGIALRGLNVRAIARTLKSVLAPQVSNIAHTVVGEINSQTDWSAALIGVDCVIHCAARAHVMHETASDALLEYRVVNVEGTRRLAEQAAGAGVRRLVFLSSAKVGKGKDPYSSSKWEAEQALWEVSAKTGLEIVVLRPPLIYGPGVKGNLARLLKLVRSGVPLPLGAVQNKRSLIGLDNLVDLLIRCVDHPAAAGQTFLVSDGEDLSTPDLFRYMAAAMGRPARLFPVPVSLLRLVGAALDKQAEIDRLVGSLQVDSSHTRQVLDWAPPVTVTEGIRRMVQRA